METARQHYGEGEWSKWFANLSEFRRDLQLSENHQWATGPGVTLSLIFLSFREGTATAQEVVALANQLGQFGVDFIYVSIPNKVEIYPEKFSAHLPDGMDRVNPAKSELFHHFAEQNVEVIDLEPVFLEFRKNNPDTFLFMAGKDPHFSPQAAVLAGETIAERLRPRHYLADALDKTEFVEELEPHEWGSYFGWKDTFPVIVHRVKAKNTGLFYDNAPDSPVAIVGDSHTTWWQSTMTKNGGLAAHATKRLGFQVCLGGISGGMAHDLDRLPAAWFTKRKVVLLVQTTHLIHNLDYPAREVRFAKPE